MYGIATDPLPYIQASYLIGFVFVFGYSTWLFLSRRKTEKYLEAFNKDLN